MPRSTTGIDYGHTHQKIRERIRPQVEAGHATCWRCHKPIPANAPWDLGHTDDGNSYAGPEHRRCNRAAAADKTNRQRLNPRSRDW